jgi:hypothetical protein
LWQKVGIRGETQRITLSIAKLGIVRVKVDYAILPATILTDRDPQSRINLILLQRETNFPSIFMEWVPLNISTDRQKATILIFPVLVKISNLFIGSNVILKIRFITNILRIEGEGVFLIDRDSTLSGLKYIENLRLSNNIKVSLEGTLIIESLLYSATEKSLVTISQYTQRLSMIKNGDPGNYEFDNTTLSSDFSAIQYCSKIEDINGYHCFSIVPTNSSKASSFCFVQFSDTSFCSAFDINLTENYSQINIIYLFFLRKTNTL